MHPTTPFRSLLKWIAAHALVVAIVSAINFSMSADDFNLIVLLALSGIISGFCIGTVEAWLLRSLLPKLGGWWVVTTIGTTPVGIAVGTVLLFGTANLALLNVAKTSIEESIGLGLFGFGIGAVVGVGQWGFLRRRFRHAWLWIVATTVGRSLGWAACLGLAYQLDLNKLPDSVLSTGMGMVGGTIYGSITGLCLVWLMAYCQRERAPFQQATED